MDFITPVLDDPYHFGQAAAANALGDIYAMGGRPVSAMAVCGFPAASAGLDILAEILRGGRDKVAEAGAELVGGHTIEDAEPKYGLAVTGVARRDQLLLQSEARPGDALFLTKPLGGGVLSTALKREGLPQGILAELTLVLTSLNRPGRDAAVAVEARAATDVTGFGLLGHLSHLLVASGVGAVIRASAMPFIAGAPAAAEGGLLPGGARRNLEFAHERVRLRVDPVLPAWKQLLLADPMTSGGLLVAVPADRSEEFITAVSGGRIPPGWCARIGEITDRRLELEIAG